MAVLGPGAKCCELDCDVDCGFKPTKKASKAGEGLTDTEKLAEPKTEEDA